MGKGRITLLIGLPRSGKTFFCDNIWIKQKDVEGLPRVILSGDDIRKSLSNDRFNEYTEQFVSAIINTSLRALVNRGHHVCIDDTHTSWFNIKSKLFIDPNLYIKWMIPNGNVDSPEFCDYIALCQERAISTNQGDLVPVIDRMTENLRKLLPDFNKKLAEYREEARNYKFVIR